MIVAILITLLILVTALLIAAVYACFNTLKKVEFYEQWVLNLQADVQNVYDELKAVDDKQLFDKDDDVGFVFTEIVDIIKELNDRTQQETDTEDDKKN